MAADRPTGQEDVEDIIIEVLENRSVITTAEVTQAVKARIELVAADRQRAAKRENESKIDQIIANALQASRRICREGLIERVERGQFRITAAGRAYLAQNKSLAESMTQQLVEMFPNEDWT